MPYDSVGFAKMHTVSGARQHAASYLCNTVRDESSLVKWIWSRPSMVVVVPTSTPLSLPIMSVIATRGGLILLLVVILLPIRRRGFLLSDAFDGVFESMA